MDSKHILGTRKVLRLKQNWAPANLMASKEKKEIPGSGRRGKMEIIAAILAITQKPSSSTRIMRHIKLNYSATKEYLEFMIEKHLIRERTIDKAGKNEARFEATRKGIIFLKKYCDLLRSLYGEDFLKRKNNLAIICLQLPDDTEVFSRKNH